MANIEQYINMGLKCGKNNESEIPSIDISKIEIPRKGYLQISKYLSEFKTKEEKARALSNLGITPLLEELRELINSNLILYDSGLHSDSFNKVLSSAVLYNIFSRYYNKNEVNNIINNLANVAKTGSYNDLTDKPDNVEQIQSDWSESNSNSKSFIKNKPTNVSQFINDSNYLTADTLLSYLEGILDEIDNIITKDDLEDYVTKEELFDMQNPLKVTISVSPTIAEYTGNPQNVVITALTKKGNNDITPDLCKITYKNNIEDFDKSCTVLISNKGITVFTINCTYKSELASATGSINLVLPTYFGFDNTEDFNLVNLSKLTKRIKGNILSTETLNNTIAGSYLWIVSPYTLNAVATDLGFTYKVAMVLEGTKDGLNYYRSNSAIDISNLTYYIK